MPHTLMQKFDCLKGLLQIHLLITDVMILEVFIFWCL